MKEFNLEQALAGEPAVTRDGRKVLLIVEHKTKYGDLVVAVVSKDEERPQCFDVWETGKYYRGDVVHDNDVFMAPIKKEAWVNIYEAGAVSNRRRTKHEAIAAVKNSAGIVSKGYITTTKIEWEE